VFRKVAHDATHRIAISSSVNCDSRFNGSYKHINTCPDDLGISMTHLPVKLHKLWYRNLRRKEGKEGIYVRLAARRPVTAEDLIPATLVRRTREDWLAKDIGSGSKLSGERLWG
jgi:hypothetical protein